MADSITRADLREMLLSMAKEMQPGLFSHTAIGGEGDNSDIIQALKESDEKRAALSKAEKQLYKEMQEKLNIKEEVSDLTDVIRKQDQAKALQSVAKKIKLIQEAKYSDQKEFDEAIKDLAETAKQAGTDIKSLGIKTFSPLHNASQKQIYTIKEAIKLSKELNEQAEEELEVTQDVIDAARDMSESYDKNKSKLDKFGGAVKKLGKRFFELAENEQRFAQATATADAGWIDGMYRMGISQLDYMKILKDTRQEGLAAASAGVDFKGSLEESTKSLRGLTSNYTEAAMGAKFFHKNMARIGVSQDQLGDSVAQQTKMYEQNYRALGFTVEEFANLTNELINDQGMRSTLLGLQEDERKAYVLSVQQRQAEYLTMGYTIERAKELQKTFQALNKMNPKERMKQAARTRAMMGAMGMGAEGGRLFELQTKYRTMGPEEKAAAEKEMAQIQAKASKRFGSMSGSGASMGQAMVMQNMADATGFTQVADTFETETGQGLKFDQQQLDVTNEISGFVKQILGAVDHWGAASNSAVGSLATGLLSMLGDFIMVSAGIGLLGGMSKPGGGLMKGIIGGVKGALGVVIKPIVAVGSAIISNTKSAAIVAKKVTTAATPSNVGKLAEGAITGVTSAATAAMTGVGRFAEGAISGVKTATTGVGKLAEGAISSVKNVVSSVAQNQSGKLAQGAVSGGKTAASAVGLGLSKAAGKTALKAIPGIGLIVSMGLMGSRLADGDYVGAGMELLSGAAGLLPGVGTVASIGMSGAIVARDLAMDTPNMNQADADSVPTHDLAKAAPNQMKATADDITAAQEETSFVEAKSQETVLKELTDTMKTLNEFLISVTTLNGDQAKTLDKAANAIAESQRWVGVYGARAAT